MKHLLRKLFFWDASVVKGEPYPGLLFATMLLAIPSPLFLCWLFCCRQFLHFTERVSYGMVMVLGLFVYSLAIKYIAVGGLFKDCFRRKLTMAVCLTVFVLFDWLLLGFLSFRRRKPLALLLSVVSGIDALSLHRRDTERAEAIITQGITNAKSSPDRSGTDLFTLHEGTKVEISETLGEWCKIRVGNNEGWISLQHLERI